MYRYIDYFIKCIIRQFTRLIFKPKIFISVLVILLVLFLWFCNSSLAVYQGDDTYTDPNNTIYLAYKTINSDLINRLSNTTSSTLSSVINNLKRSDRSYYIYYGEPNGSSLINSSTFNTNDLFIAFYPSSSQSSGTTFDIYQGISCTIRLITNTTAIFKINSDGITQIDAQNFYIPSVLINYYDSSLVDFINNSSSKETSEIVSAIESQTQATEQQTTKIEEQTQVQQDTQNFIKDESVEEGSMTISTSEFDTSDSADVDNFLSNFMNTVKSSFSGITSEDVVFINIPIPKTDQNIVLRSDILSSRLQGTSIYVIIQIFYVYLFGSYLCIYVYRIYSWLSTGQIAENGVSSFIRYLDKNNQIISTYMM